MAGRIPEHIIQEIKARLSIREVVSDYVTLTKDGANYKGLCPFHKEKTPSFKVHDGMGIFRCFGCGEGGNIFNFLMKIEGITFSEAVRRLASRAGVEIPREEKTQQDKEQDQKRDRILSANELAEAFYVQMLWDEGQGRKAREYLSSRNISEDWAKTFRIGFAPDDWEAILRHLKDKDFDESIIQQAGLIIKRDTGGFYDRFRNRLMFPIRDVSGRVRGFGGRTLDDSDESPKYINSPETAVFKKGQGFYGLDLAKDKIRQADRAVIVEGYFDRIRLHMAGVECALASLGTAFTAEQARMVRRYTRNVFTVFDTDSAGVKASLRALEAFLEEGITPRMVILPSSKDPDEFLEKAGGEAFLQLLDTAPTLVDFFLEKELEKGSATPAETAQAVVRMAPVLSKIREPIERGLYVKRLSERLGIPQAEIQRRLVRPVRKQGEKESETEPVGIEEDFFSIIEKELLALLINHPHVAERIESENVLDLFSNTHLATIMRTLIDQIKKTGRPDIGLIIHDIEDENLARLLTRLAMDDKEKYPDHIIDNVLEEFILKLKYENLNNEKESVQRQLNEAEKNKQQDRINQLRLEQNRLFKLDKKFRQNTALKR